MVGAVSFVLPLLIIGIGLVIIFINYRSKENAEGTKNYLVEGMCVGLCLGVAVSASAHFNMGLGIGIGMLTGEIVGILIQKN